MIDREEIKAVIAAAEAPLSDNDGYPEFQRRQLAVQIAILKLLAAMAMPPMVVAESMLTQDDFGPGTVTVISRESIEKANRDNLRRWARTRSQWHEGAFIRKDESDGR